MKKVLAALLVLAMLIGSIGCGKTAQEAPQQEAPKQEAPKQEAPKQEAPKQEAPKQEAPAAPEIVDGTYKATAKGFYGDYEVTVEVKNGAIASAVAGDNNETPTVGGIAIGLLEQDVVNYNTAGVDIITGATLSSFSFINAVKDCLKQAQAQDKFTAKVEYPSEEKNIDADVVVVGAGGAGFSAAIAAAEAGAKVYLIEKQGIVGGSTLLSAGIVYAPMDEKDIPAMVDYYQMRDENKGDQAIIEFYANNSLATIKFLEDCGVQWMMTVPAGTAPEPRARFSMGSAGADSLLSEEQMKKQAAAAGFSGASLILPLQARAKKAGVNLLTNCKGTKIVAENGVVKGLEAEGRNIKYHFNAKAVIITCGGYDASEDMKKEYSPIAVGDFPLSNKGNVGEGIKMGMEVGADTEFKGGTIGFDIVDGSLNTSGQSGISMGAAVYVGEDGSYIVNNIDYPVTHTNLKKSGFKKFFGIYDAAGEASGELAISLGFGWKADSIEELAKATGMDAAKLAESIGKVESLAAAPYYAVQVKPATIGSMGGLKINTKAEVLDKSGKPIAGLYSAGESANGGLYYQEYPASGTSNSMSMTFGLEAGRNAAEYCK